MISTQISIIGYYTIDYIRLSRSSFFFFFSLFFSFLCSAFDVCVGKCLLWLEHMASGKCSFFLITTLFLFLPMRMCSIEMKKKLLGRRRTTTTFTEDVQSSVIHWHLCILSHLLQFVWDMSFSVFRSLLLLLLPPPLLFFVVVDVFHRQISPCQSNRNNRIITMQFCRYMYVNVAVVSFFGNFGRTYSLKNLCFVSFFLSSYFSREQ